MKKKIFVIISLILIIISIFCTSSYAKSSLDDLGPLDQYDGRTTVVDIEGKDFKDMANTVIAIIRNVGIAISVIALIAIGIKYMLGSVEERADYKKTMIPYLIGAALVFSMSTLPQIIYEFTKNL